MDVHEMRETWPWLVFGHGCGPQVFVASDDDATSVCSVLDLENKKLWNCCHGWLILSDGPQFSLLNPVSLESFSLPHLELSDDITACVLSSDPSSITSTLFLFCDDAKAISFCRIHREDKRWIKHCYRTDLTNLNISGNRKIKDYLQTPIACDGKLYGVTFRKLILVQIEVVEKDETVVLEIQPLIQLPMPLEQSVRWLNMRRLVESCGEIFTVIVIFEERNTSERFGNEIIGIEVYKLNLSANAWERVLSLGDRAFFSCGCGISFSWPADSLSGISGSHLYFTRGRDVHLYSFDIEEGTLSVKLLVDLNSYDLWDSSFPISAYYSCLDAPTPQGSPMLLMPRTRSTNSFGEPLSKNKKDEQIPNELMEAGVKKKHRLKPRNSHDIYSDIWNNISHKLDFFAYKNFGAGCSIWRKAAPPDEVNRFVSPWLLYFQKSKGVFSVVSPDRSDRYIVQVPESLQDATVCHCKDGWLLMCKYTQATGDQLSVNFVNPFTKNVIRFPDLSLENFTSSRFGFSCSPTSSSCVVIVVTFCGLGKGAKVNFCSSREEGWNCFGLRGISDRVERLSRNLVFANGAFYFMSHFAELGLLRLDSNRSDRNLTERTRRSYISGYQGFLAECNGELISVFINDKVKCMCFKLNRSTLSWEKITSLGKQTMYVSRMSSFLMLAETPEMEDKIYLPRFHENGAMVSLCLRTGKYRLVSDEGSSRDLCSTREQLRSCWIRPN